MKNWTRRCFLLLILMLNHTYATPTTRQLPSLANFNNININVPVTVLINDGAKQNIQMTGDTTLFNQLIIAVDHGRLSLSSGNLQFPQNNNLTVSITVPTLSALNIGEGTVNVQTHTNNALAVFSNANNGSLTINGTALNLTRLAVTGNSPVTINGIHSAELDLGLTNQATVHLSGDATMVNAEVNDRARLDAAELAVQNDAVTTTGNAQANVRAIATLMTNAMDSSDIYYYQQPQFLMPQMQNNGSVLPIFANASAYPISFGASFSVMNPD